MEGKELRRRTGIKINDEKREMNTVREQQWTEKHNNSEEHCGKQENKRTSRQEEDTENKAEISDNERNGKQEQDDDVGIGEMNMNERNRNIRRRINDENEGEKSMREMR